MGRLIGVGAWDTVGRSEGGLKPPSKQGVVFLLIGPAAYDCSSNAAPNTRQKGLRFYGIPKRLVRPRGSTSTCRGASWLVDPYPPSIETAELAAV